MGVKPLLVFREAA